MHRNIPERSHPFEEAKTGCRLLLFNSRRSPLMPPRLSWSMPNWVEVPLFQRPRQRSPVKIQRLRPVFHQRCTWPHGLYLDAHNAVFDIGNAYGHRTCQCKSGLRFPLCDSLHFGRSGCVCPPLRGQISRASTRFRLHKRQTGIPSGWTLHSYFTQKMTMEQRLAVHAVTEASR